MPVRFTAVLALPYEAGKQEAHTKHQNFTAVRASEDLVRKFGSGAQVCA